MSITNDHDAPGTMTRPDGSHAVQPQATRLPTADCRLPLDGVRVLSQGIVWAGPYATMMLADLGAEVIEVESIQHLNPTRGTMRHPPPAFMDGPRGAIYYKRDPSEGFWNRQSYFNYGKRGHKSVTLDITRAAGKDLFFRLVARSDVFLENNAAGVVEKWGIDYPELSRVNPRLIMVRFPGYGIEGPYKHFKGYGANVEAVVGHTLLRGYRDSDPSLTPAIFHADPNAGAHVAFAIMAALLARERTGAGQLIDLSQAEAVIPHLAYAFMDYAMNRRLHGHPGNRHPSMAPYGVFPAAGAGPHPLAPFAVRGDSPADPGARWGGAPAGPGPNAGRGGGTENDRASSLSGGHGGAAEYDRSPTPDLAPNAGGGGQSDEWIAIAVPSDEAFAALCGEMGRPELARDPRFADVVSRHRNQDELEPIIADWTRQFSPRELMARLQRAGVPATAVLRQPEMDGDPHLQARGFWEPITHPETGTHRYPGPLAKLARTPLHARGPAPRLGEHNAEILKGLLGVRDDEYERLLATRVIGAVYLDAAR